MKVQKTVTLHGFAMVAAIEGRSGQMDAISDALGRAQMAMGALELRPFGWQWKGDDLVIAVEATMPDEAGWDANGSPSEDS